jgi:NADH-quinone oxidoreductase subunit E
LASPTEEEQSMADSRPWEQFEPERRNILRMFHATQAANADSSSLTRDDLAGIAEYLGLPAAEVSGVASFYQAFARAARGRHVIRVCDSLSCRISGSLSIYHALRDHLGVGRGETTRDGQFTVEIVNCLGSCDTAPNLMIDDALYTHVKPEDLPEILASVARGKEAAS